MITEPKLEQSVALWTDKNDLHMHEQKLLIAGVLEFFEPGSIRGHYYDEASSLVSDRVKDALEEAMDESPAASAEEIVAAYSYENAENDVYRYCRVDLIDRFTQASRDNTSSSA